MCEAMQVGIWSFRDPYDNYTTPRTNLHPRRVLELILILLQSPATSREKFHPQASLKYHYSSSLDYRVHHGLLVLNQSITYL